MKVFDLAAALLCSFAIISVVTGLNNEEKTSNLRGLNDNKLESVIAKRSLDKKSSKEPSSKGKGKGGKSEKSKKKSSKEPSSKGKGKGGKSEKSKKKSSKEPSSKGKGKGGKSEKSKKKSSKEPSSNGKGGKSEKSKKTSKKAKKGGKSSKSPSDNGNTTVPTPSVINRCNTSDAARVDSIRDIITSLSNLNAINTNGSPQKRAFTWLTQQDSAFVCPDERQTVLQRYTLAVVYFATNGDNWDKCNRRIRDCSTEFGNGQIERFSPYLSNDNVCNWFGISCDSSKAITHVLLGGEDFFVGVDGPLPSEIFLLPSVKTISFDGSKNINETRRLNGQIPVEIGNAVDLRTLDMDRNNLTGPIPRAISNLDTLVLLDLDNNRLTGTIANKFGSLTNLQFLTVGNNNFLRQQVPADISNLSKLASLGLQNSNLFGPVPTVYSKLTSMQALDMSDNQCSGTIDFISSYNKLETLALQNNEFVGNIPNSIWSNVAMKLIDVSNNKFEGVIPENVGNLRNLISLRLANNNFSGDLPASLKNLAGSIKLLTLENNNFNAGATVPAELCRDQFIRITIDNTIECPGNCCIVVNRG